MPLRLLSQQQLDLLPRQLDILLEILCRQLDLLTPNRNKGVVEYHLQGRCLYVRSERSEHSAQHRGIGLAEANCGTNTLTQACAGQRL